MPFTGSHPAAVLPLAGVLPFSALAIGSMSPDAFSFLPLPVPAGFTHSPLGVVSVDLVAGLVAYAVWHLVLVPPLLDAWPALAARVAAARWRRAGPVPVLLALVVGGATHVFWDSFTHPGRWGSTRIPALSALQGPIEGYRWAQYASGVIGALLLAASARRWWRRHRGPDDGPGVRRHGVAGGLVCLGAAAVAGLGAAAFALGPAGEGLRLALFQGATRGGAAGALVLLLLAAGWWVTRGLGHRRGEAAS